MTISREVTSLNLGILVEGLSSLNTQTCSPMYQPLRKCSDIPSLKVLFQVFTFVTPSMAPTFLRPANNTQVFLVFLCFQVNAEMFSRFQVAIASFLCRPSNLNSSKLSPIAVKLTFLSELFH
jgi:hypothetical protein